MRIERKRLNYVRNFSISLSISLSLLLSLSLTLSLSYSLYICFSLTCFSLKYMFFSLFALCNFANSLSLSLSLSVTLCLPLSTFLSRFIFSHTLSIFSTISLFLSFSSSVTLSVLTFLSIISIPFLPLLLSLYLSISLPISRSNISLFLLVYHYPFSLSPLFPTQPLTHHVLSPHQFYLSDDVLTNVPPAGGFGKK